MRHHHPAIGSRVSVASTVASPNLGFPALSAGTAGRATEIPGRGSPCHYATYCGQCCRLIPGTTQIEGWRPRIFASFSTPMQQALAYLLKLAKDFGNYPEDVRQVVTVLLPKPDGGMRPTNLFPGVFRLHGRILAQPASPGMVGRPWESCTAISCGKP
jgi:hypothetical protein